MKRGTLFLPLHPVLFYRPDYEKQKHLKLVTNLFELQKIFTKISFWYDLLKLETGKKREKIDKALNVFIIFEMLSFGKILKTEDTSFKFEYLIEVG